MITGYNTDVGHLDLVFHVQTEDKGVKAANIESLVYVGGQILGKRRTGYRDILDGDGGKAAIVDLMDRQHRLMIAEIRNGHYDSQLVELGLLAADAVAPVELAPDPSTTLAPAGTDSRSVAIKAGQESSVAGTETLDEIILEYLNAEAEKEHLVLMMEVERDFELGAAASLEFRTKASVSGMPVSGTTIVVKMISTVAEPATLAEGQTDDNGQLRLDLGIPDLRRGSSALIVTASSDIGTAEIKHLL